MRRVVLMFAVLAAELSRLLRRRLKPKPVTAPASCI